MRLQIARAAAILLLAGRCFPQASSTISLSNGLELRIAANLGQPTGEETLHIEMHRASGDSFYRIFRDQNNLAVFAYELAVRRVGSDAVSMTAKPAESEFAARFPNADAGKPVPSLSSEQEFGPLRSGDRAELGLFEIPGMGLKVSENFQMKLNQDDTAAANSGPIRLSGVRVLVEGTPVAVPGPRGPVSGRYAMFYIPGRGGYFFATGPPAGRAFLAAGSIDRNRIKFVVDNETYECIANAPILANAEGGEVWVYHDPDYKPAGNWTSDLKSTGDEFFMAAADSLSWWLP